MNKYFNNTDAQIFNPKDLMGRTLEIRQFREIENDNMTVTMAMDTKTGELFVLDIEYATTSGIAIDPQTQVIGA